MDSLTSEGNENVFLFLFISSFVSFEVWSYLQQYFDSLKNKTSNRKYLLELIKRKSKVHKKNVSREIALNFVQSKTFSENYKLITVTLWLVYKIT